MNLLPLRMRPARDRRAAAAKQRAIDEIYRRSLVGSIALIAATKLAKGVMDGTATPDEAEAVLRLIAEIGEKPKT